MGGFGDADETTAPSYRLRSLTRDVFPYTTYHSNTRPILSLTTHTQVQRTSATLMQSEVEPELMASVQSRALKAEKEAARLRAALQAAQHEGAMWRERAKGLEQLRS